MNRLLKITVTEPDGAAWSYQMTDHIGPALTQALDQLHGSGCWSVEEA